MAHGKALFSGGICFGSVEYAYVFLFQHLTPLYITHSANSICFRDFQCVGGVGWEGGGTLTQHPLSMLVKVQ